MGDLTVRLSALFVSVPLLLAACAGDDGTSPSASPLPAAAEAAVTASADAAVKIEPFGSTPMIKISEFISLRES